MPNLLLRSGCTCLPLLLVGFLLPHYSVDGQSFDPTKVKGDLQKIKEPLSKLIKFKTKNGRLETEVEKTRQTAYNLINQINTIGGNRGGGSSSSGSTWEIRINNNSFEGVCNYGYSRVYPKPNPNTWKIKLKELKKPNRDLYIESNPEGEVSITLYGGDDPYLLRIRQMKSGSLFVQEISDTEIFSETAPSFNDFCRRYSKFTQNRFLPMIRHLGIDAPMTQFDKEVQQSVINFLTPIDQTQLTSFQTSFKNLDSTDYKKRQQDARKLSEGFEDWKDFVLRAVNDSEFSFEVRFRLMEALEKNGKPEVIKASRYAISTDLARNPEYLVWLFESNKDSDIRQNILTQLRKATGEDLGEQIAVWKDKYESSQSLVAKPVEKPKVDLLSESGALDTVTAYINELVKLKSDNGKLVLDRGYWAEQFGGKSIQQLVKETNENLAKLNMPANYDPDPLFELGSVGHPQAIFGKMRSKLQQTSKSSTVYYYSYNRTSSSSLNRQFNNNALNVAMNFEPNTTSVRRTTNKNVNAKPPNLDGKPFKLDCQELAEGRRSFIVDQKTDGRLRLAIVTEKSNAFVQMLQSPEGGFIVQDVRGADVFTAKGESFDDFVSKHKEYCLNSLFPLFHAYGVKFDKKLYDAPDLPKKPKTKESDSTKNPKSRPRARPAPSIRLAPKKAVIRLDAIKK